MRYLFGLLILVPCFFASINLSWADVADNALKEGNRLLNAGQVREAVPYFDRAIKLRRQFIEAYYGRGNAYAQLRAFEKSIMDYSYALSLNPNDLQKYTSTGVAPMQTSANMSLRFLTTQK